MPEIVVLDTDVLLFLVGDEKSQERTDSVRARISEMKKRKFHFWIPAPVLAELGSRSGNPQPLVAALEKRLGVVRIATFGLPAASACSKMLQAAHKRAAEGGHRYASTRAAMKFDVLIAAVAHTINARMLATANPGDFMDHFEIVSSKTQVHRADVPDLNFASQMAMLDEKPEDEKSIVESE